MTWPQRPRLVPGARRDGKSLGGRVAVEHDVLDEAEAIVHDLDGARDLALAHHAGDSDRRGRDDPDVDAGLSERVEHVGGHAGMALHPRPDERDLRDLAVEREAARAHLTGDAL